MLVGKYFMNVSNLLSVFVMVHSHDGMVHRPDYQAIFGQYSAQNGSNIAEGSDWNNTDWLFSLGS